MNAACTIPIPSQTNGYPTSFLILQWRSVVGTRPGPALTSLWTPGPIQRRVESLWADSMPLPAPVHLLPRWGRQTADNTLPMGPSPRQDWKAELHPAWEDYKQLVPLVLPRAWRLQLQEMNPSGAVGTWWQPQGILDHAWVQVGRGWRGTSFIG